MDEKLKSIEKLLISKKLLFEEYEKITQQIFQSKEDEMPKLVEKRQSIIEEINHIDNSKNKLAEETKYGKIVIDAEKNRKPRCDYPKELLPIYDKGQEIFTSMNRASKLDKCIIEKAKGFKNKAEKAIRKNNHVPKIAAYYSQQKEQQQILLSKKYEKV